ncbi:MAG: DotA/TraY family protein [Alphaproteobacteria bacterium]
MVNETRTAANNYNTNGTDIEITQDILDRGWAGAGIWFNRLARVNGAFMDSVQNTPVVENYPKIMEDIRKERRIHDPDITGINQFMPYLSNGEAVEIEDGSKGTAIGIVLNNVLLYWNKDVKNQASNDGYFTGGMLENAMNMIFGLDGLFDMRGDNAHIHPLAQLTALGKGMVDSSIRNIAGSSLAAAFAGPAKAIDSVPGQLADAASDFLVGTAFIGLTAGLVLYYVVPFLPFVYFFFAVASWIKTIFEAMVGAPLWALAHLRLDGDGLPGDSASNGYFLIFEIFVRPILSVFGLIAALVIFTAQVRVLHFIWGLVTDNLTGFDTNPIIDVNNQEGDFMFERGIIDQFFFTVLYAIIVYLMATASFKLIDKIPDNILRWMGAGVSSFGDINQDPTERLASYASLGGMTIGPQVARGIQGAAKESGMALGGEIQKMAQTLRN